MASVQYKKGKNGKRTYYVVVSLGGRHKWIRAGSIREAKILKREVESMEESRKREKLGLVSRQKRIDGFLQEYLDHVKLRTSPNTTKRYRAVLNTFLTFLKMFHPNLRSLSQIKQEHIESYQNQRLESVGLKTAADGDKVGAHKNKRLPLPQTVNYEVSVLRSAFMWAQEREWIANVPTKKVKPLKPIPKRQARIFTPVECNLFLKTARGIAKTNKRLKVYFKAFKFLLNTGLRSGELCNLTWEDVDMETGLIKIQPKAGWTPKSYSREFYLNKTSQNLLKSIGQSDGYVFEDSGSRQLEPDNLRKVLMRVTKAAGLKGFTRVHDLRHTFNSLMQMKGVDPATMGKILGHKDIETTMIYTHQTIEHLKKSIDKVRIG